VDARLIAVSAVALFIAAALSIFGNVDYYGDSHTYVVYALDLAKRVHNPNLFYRTPGYPLILLATGFAATGSLQGLLWLQAAAGAACVTLGYWIVSPAGRRIALVAGGALILSLTTYAFINTIYPDQLYMLCLLGFAAVVSRQILRPHPSHVYILAALILAVTWLRPVGLAVGAACLIVPLVQRGYRRHAVIGMMIVLIVMTAFTRLIERRREPESSFFLGRQLFSSVYWSSDGLPDAFSDDESSAAKALRAQLVDWFSEKSNRITILPPLPAETYHELFGQFRDDPQGQVAAIFRRPHLMYYWAIFCISTRDCGSAISDRDLFFAAVGHIARHPVHFAGEVIAVYKGLVLGPAWRYRGKGFGRDAIRLETLQFNPLVPQAKFMPTLENQPFIAKSLPLLERRPLPAWAPAVRAWFDLSYPLCLPVFYVLALIGAIGYAFSSGAERVISWTCLAVHTVNVGTLAALVDPQFRYQIQSVPLIILAGVIGILRLQTMLLWVVARARSGGA
jgi:hypothetical protein